MAINADEAIRHLDSVLFDYEALARTRSQDLERVLHVTIRLKSAIERLAPPQSHYRIEPGDEWVDSARMEHFAGAASALRDDYAGGFLGTYREMINAELFSDLLNVAEQLLQSDKLRLPAAMTAGVVLEEHLRKLSDKHGIPVVVSDGDQERPKRASALNQELRAKGVYNLNEQQQVTAWLSVRNSAAHGHQNEFDEQQVIVMIIGIRGFISRYPA